MKVNEVIKHENVGEKFYVLYDETDTNHCIMIGAYLTLKDTAKSAKEYKANFPGAIVQAYEMIRQCECK